METPRTERRGGTFEEARGMSTKLKDLPKPRNEFELVLPEEEEETEEEEMEWVEDAERIDSRAAEKEKKRQEAEHALRSQPFKRQLPIPEKLNPQYQKRNPSNKDLDIADNLIKEEVYRLMEWDVLGKVPQDIYEADDMNAARALIDEEMEAGPELNSQTWKVIKECGDELIAYNGRFTRLSKLGRREQIEALTAKFNVSSLFPLFLCKLCLWVM